MRRSYYRNIVDRHIAIWVKNCVWWGVMCKEEHEQVPKLGRPSLVNSLSFQIQSPPIFAPSRNDVEESKRNWPNWKELFSRQTIRNWSHWLQRFVYLSLAVEIRLICVIPGEKVWETWDEILQYKKISSQVEVLQNQLSLANERCTSLHRKHVRDGEVTKVRGNCRIYFIIKISIHYLFVIDCYRLLYLFDWITFENWLTDYWSMNYPLICISVPGRTEGALWETGEAAEWAEGWRDCGWTTRKGAHCWWGQLSTVVI